ncbi:hypothetical protein [Mesoterricola silvestris]|uniref:Protein kinase domain-containing protein n=1 Tax=Mesoterricola silvestris TaxID=2927979 RepID=A0AA48KCH3_9BACT|nr:hypothetical protein [Mesoterricola silvestris]BDU73508.1 hypothetical protein METEAL_26820 [Mesoterricola silvestris]
MTSYTRLGSYMLSSELTADPIGRIHRGLSLAGSAFEKHNLLRTFSDELVEAGIGARIAEAQKVAGILAGGRGFGVNYHAEAGRTPHVVCDYVAGRSLAQVLKKTREEQIPLGVDHSLSVIQGLAMSLMSLAAKDLHHGALSPHSIWVSFEGATQIIDAPYAGILAGLLPKAKGLEKELAPYRAPLAKGPLAQDLYALGAVLYELLTLEKLPAAEAIPAALSRATLKAAMEDGPLPAEIAGLLNRLLLDTTAFGSMGDFNKELERVLYDGDYSPTTFNMAFYMHTLFREESDQDAQAMKADQSVDYAPFLPSEGASRSVLVGADGQSRVKYFVYAGAAAVALIGFAGYKYRELRSENNAIQVKLAELQQLKAANENKLMDIAKQEESQKALQDQLAKKAAEAKTAEERAKAKKDLEESKAKALELARQKDEALKKQQELTNRGNSIAMAAQKTPPPPPPQPATPPPAPAPAKQEAPVAVATPVPQPAAPAASQQDTVETAATLVRRVSPTVPRLANKAFLPANVRDSDIKVILKIFVDAQGRPVKVVIVQGVAGPFGYNDAAQTAALASGYAPATRNGKPTTGWMTLEYNFGKAR